MQPVIKFRNAIVVKTDSVRITHDCVSTTLYLKTREGDKIRLARIEVRHFIDKSPAQWKTNGAHVDVDAYDETYRAYTNARYEIRHRYVARNIPTLTETKYETEHK